MALEKLIIVDRIEVLENGSVQVRTKTAIMEDGKQISGTFHRHVVAPGDDYAAEDARVQAICESVHTPEVCAEYQASIAQPE
jgi:nucleoside-triphosphatase THEP1